MKEHGKGDVRTADSVLDLFDSGGGAASLRALYAAQTQAVAELFGWADPVRRFFSGLHDGRQHTAAFAAAGE